MRIAFFTDVYRPTINGVVASIDSFANELRSRGHEVTIICPSYPDVEDDEYTLRVRAITFPTYKEYRLASPLSAKVEKHMKENVYDVIHIHSPFSIGLTGIFYAKRFRLPVVYTAHTNYADYRHYVHGGGIIPQSVIDRLAAHFSNNIDLTVVPSQKIASSLERYGTKKPVTIIPTGVAKPQAGSRAAFKKRYDLGRAVNLLYVGRLTKEKSVDFLIRSFAEALDQLDPKTKLVIVGDGPYRKELERLADELVLTGRVVFTGFLSGDDLADAYRGVDAFCHTSYSETQGMTLLEAASYGLPLVVSDDDAYAGIAKDGINALIAGPDIEEYAELLVRISGDAELRQQFSKASKEIAKQFSMPDQAEKLIEQYGQVIANKRVSVVYTTE